MFLESFRLKKVPARRRRNLKTFSEPKVTVSKQKKEIKDNKTVSCLRKKIAYSKFTNKPISDLDQFIQLPRAICDANGIPEKGQKSWATSVLKKLYPEVFIPKISPTPFDTAFIIDGMFILNTIPLSVHN